MGSTKTELKRYSLYTYISFPVWILSLGGALMGDILGIILFCIWSYILYQCSHATVKYYNAYKTKTIIEYDDFALVSVFGNVIKPYMFKFFFFAATVFYILCIVLSIIEYKQSQY